MDDTYVTGYPPFVLRAKPWLADPRADLPGTRYDRFSNTAGESMRVTYIPEGAVRTWHRERKEIDWVEVASR